MKRLYYLFHTWFKWMLHCSFIYIQAIHGYRETERLRWGPVCEEILNRVRSVAFPHGGPFLGPTHVLDLDKAGYIKPHIDSVKVSLYPHCCDGFYEIFLIFYSLPVSSFLAAPLPV